MAKRFYWLKLKNDFFESKEIKLLRRIAGGDTFTIIYLKMLLSSLKDDGFLYFDGVCNDIAEEIALTLDEEVESVKLTLAFLESKNLIEYGVNDDLKMSRINEMIGSETDKAALMRKNRERKRLEKAKTVTTLPETVTMLPDVTKRYTEKEIEKEIEKDIEKDIEKEPAKPVKARDGLDYQQIEEWYHEFCPELPTLRIMSESRKRTLKAWGNMDEIKEAFEIAGKSDFLNGKKTDFKAGFDWIIKPANRVKILEGFYNNHKAKANANGPDYSKMSEENKPDWVKKMESEYI